MQKLLDPVSGLLQTVIAVKSLLCSVWEPFTARGGLLVIRTVGKAWQEGGRVVYINIESQHYNIIVLTL